MTDPRGFWPSAPWVVGHRGSPRRHPENSQEAFDGAVADGAEVVEFDVQRSADGVLFVYHDATVRVRSWPRRGPARTGTIVRRVPVESLTYAEICEHLAQTPVVRRRGRLFGGGAPPRLEDVVTAMVGRAKLDVEIKVPGYEAEVVAVLRRHMGPDDYVVTSFHEEVVAAVKKLAPEVRVGLLLGTRGDGRSLGLFPFKRFERCGADFLVPHHLIADPALLARAERRGIPVMVYTVNSRRRLESLLRDKRLVGVITDVPDVARRVRDGLA